MAKKPYTQKELDEQITKFKAHKRRLSKSTKEDKEFKAWFKLATNGKPGDLKHSNGKDAIRLAEKSRDGYEVASTTYMEVNLVDLTA